jgi:hypothetical protein
MDHQYRWSLRFWNRNCHLVMRYWKSDKCLKIWFDWAKQMCQRATSRVWIEDRHLPALCAMTDVLTTKSTQTTAASKCCPDACLPIGSTSTVGRNIARSWRRCWCRCGKPGSRSEYWHMARTRRLAGCGGSPWWYLQVYSHRFEREELWIL